MGERLQVESAARLIDFLKARLAAWKGTTLQQPLRGGCVQVNGTTVRRHDHALKLEEGERREVDLAPAGSARLEWILEADGEHPGGISVILNRRPVATDDPKARERALAGNRSTLSLDRRFAFSGLEAGEYVLSSDHYDLTQQRWIGSANVTLSEGQTSFISLQLKRR